MQCDFHHLNNGKRLHSSQIGYPSFKITTFGDAVQLYIIDNLLKQMPNVFFSFQVFHQLLHWTLLPMVLPVVLQLVEGRTGSFFFFLSRLSCRVFQEWFACRWQINKCENIMKHFQILHFHIYISPPFYNKHQRFEWNSGGFVSACWGLWPIMLRTSKSLAADLHCPLPFDRTFCLCFYTSVHAPPSCPIYLPSYSNCTYFAVTFSTGPHMEHCWSFFIGASTKSTWKPDTVWQRLLVPRFVFRWGAEKTWRPFAQHIHQSLFYC